ncbi:serine/threonine-protein phosphatase 4 regulatory subunit 4 isoform X1 [Neodiprion pinetum]|uniref:serine/threonine-protein phosphatase 4 regulatory subunit 4 isoform X1 n=2 Tax=Neodiprion pinetum TaxID=441929 RepID=UPI001EDD1D65|nr:serine/threonine-protein phosphatase 4 regulatory subunit 4-like isoform X1 [Neodiprion pinetum]
MFAICTLLKGDDIQKLSVIHTLPTLLAGDAQLCVSRLIPKMQQTLSNASSEFHMAASSTFKTILEQKLVNPTTFTQTFLQSILNSLDSRDPVVAHAWLETLLDVIELLPTEVIRHEILPMAISKGQLSQPISSRITCCKLLGKICTRFDTLLIKKEVLPTVHSLCQDVNSDVRACICLQLSFVAQGLGVESVKPALLPSLVELASDEESTVRHASVQTIVHLLPHFQQETIKGIIAPLIKKLCESALKSDDNVICVIAQEFGRLALGLERALTVNEKTWLIRYFQQLSQLGIPSMNKDMKQEFSFANKAANSPQTNERYVECRRQCAFNFPAICLFTLNTFEKLDIILPTFTDLTSDPYYMVRRTIACGIHEVGKVLGSQNGLIKNELIRLLKDDSEEVLQGLVPHLAQTFDLLTQSQTIGTDQTDGAILDVCRAILKCEVEIANTYNWRLSALILNQLEILPRCIPSDLINSHFTPMVFNRALNARPLPVRLAAGRLLLIFLRYNLKPMQRNELRNRIYTEFAHSSNCYTRMLYIRMMQEAMIIFSTTYFKENFYTTLLSITEDPVANIRMKVVSMLPQLKAMLRMSNDKRLLAMLEGNVRALMSLEKDRDVVYTLTNVIHKLDSIDVKQDGQHVKPAAKLTRQEIDDARKLEEEKKLTAMTSSKPVATTATVNQPTTTQRKPNASGLPKQISPTTPKPSTEASIGANRQRQGSLSLVDNPYKQSSQYSRIKQPSSSEPPSKQPSPKRDGGMAPITNKRMPDAKTSTSSNNLTSSWARLTSNSMLLTHPWETINHTSSNAGVSSVNFNYNFSGDNHNTDFKTACGCSESAEDISRSRYSLINSGEQEHKPIMRCCSCFDTNTEYLKLNVPLHHKHHGHPTSEFAKSFVLTHLKENKNELQDFLLTKGNHEVVKDKEPDFAALRALTNAAHYNSCWAFSSMPEIPVTLLDDEFLVDAGIRIPAQLSSSQSTSKIPNLQDIIYRNRREGSVDRSHRSSVNFDKGKSKRQSAEYEDCVKPKVLISDPMKVKRNLDDFEEGYSLGKMSGKSDEQISKEDLKTKRYSGSYAKTKFGYEPNQSKSSDEKPKRNSLYVDKEKSKLLQSKSTIDKNKRYSANYTSRLPDVKDVKHKFKRHSLEVTECTPMPRADRAIRRYSALDVNHNQGISKIPLRSNFVSGSRTAPATRASSPVRLCTKLYFNKSSGSEVQTSTRNKFLTRFSSSDEEVDKLCHKFSTCQTATSNRAESPRTRDSRLPVRLQKKKI